jgi:hypothetical protein
MLNKGDVFGSGVRLLKKNNTETLDVTAGPVAYLHFVTAEGDTIAPEYEADGLQTYAGPISGAKITLASPVELAALVALVAALAERVVALEAVLVVSETQTKLKNPQGETLITVGQRFGDPAIGFFDSLPQPKQTLNPFEATADLAQNIAFELNAKNLTQAP